MRLLWIAALLTLPAAALACGPTCTQKDDTDRAACKLAASEQAQAAGDLHMALSLADQATAAAPNATTRAQSLQVRSRLAKTLPGYAKELLHRCHKRAPLNDMTAEATATKACVEGRFWAKKHHERGQLFTRQPAKLISHR